jgi:hypothetical protein
MSAIDEMEQRNTDEAYERGYAHGKKEERERVLRELLDISHGVCNLKEMQDRIRSFRGAP